MISRIARSCQLIKASWDVLRSDSELLVLPVLSAVATGLVIATFVALLIADDSFAAMQDGNAVSAIQSSYTWLFGFYFVQYFVMIFFNTALVGAALERLGGGDPTVGSALSLAFRRIGPILGYAVISATVGVLLRALAERLGIIGRLLGFGAALAWTVTTFLVIPVLAAEGGGPIAAIEKSGALLRKSWGENLIGNAGISLAMSLIAFFIVIVGVAGGIAILDRGSPALAVPMIAGSVVLFLMVLLVGSALSAVYAAAVYHYAAIGEPPRGFGRGLLQSAFTPKGG